MALAKRIILIITALVILTAFSACSYFLPGEKKVAAPDLIESKEVVMPSMVVRRGNLIMFHDMEAVFVPEPTAVDIAEITINGRVHEIYYFLGEEVKEGALVLELDTEAIRDKILVQEINVEKTRLNHEQNLTLYELGKVDRYTIELSGLTLEAAENYLSDLYEDLEKHYIYAPSDGVIVSMKFAVGNNAFGDAFEVSKLEDGIVEVLIRSNIDQMTPAQEAIFDIEIGEPAIMIYEGVEYALEMKRDSSTYFTEVGYDAEYSHHQFTVLEMPEGLGFNKRLTLRNVTGEALDTVVIPMSAVYSAASDPYTYVINGREFVKRYIEIGMDDGYFYEVVAGLQEGEEILKIN
jgi:multidrug efflux pump subunit AcrA (membrane-fusion protein)